MTGTAAGVTRTGAAGHAAPGLAAGPDTVFRIFSMPKAIGSTAAMILIDRGQMDFDTPVDAVLPEFRDIKVLDGWDGDTPRLRAPRISGHRIDAFLQANLRCAADDRHGCRGARPHGPSHAGV